VLAKMFGAKVLLGSATPSLESIYNCKREKYGLVELKERFGGIQLPEILVADLKKETKERTMKSHFSSFLLGQIEEVLERKEQVILFQNRRGYASLWNCETCGWTPECVHCDVSLTYHKHLHLLICHYCGNRYKPPQKCGKCGSAKLSMLGFGTEKIEDQLPDFFPKVRVARLDYDTTRSKNAYHNLISRFEAREIDVLVGTQMVTKGLDFDNVSLVGVMNADSMLNFPDFRAFERAFQMLTQVAGRSGRKEKRGKVVVQTWQPYHWIVRKVIEGDFDGMATQELAERRQFKYPPYYRMVTFVLRHRDRNVLDAKSALFAQLLRRHFADRILGPEYLPIARVKNRYQKQIILKLEKSLSFKSSRQLIRDRMDDFYGEKSNRSVQIAIDVDPV
jgi:primosomal protein N' (replication factor Y)